MNDLNNETVSKCEIFGPEENCFDYLDFHCCIENECGYKYCFKCSACDTCKKETEQQRG